MRFFCGIEWLLAMHQIAFVLVVLGIIKLLSYKKDWPLFIKKAPAYAIGSLAAFWMIERVIKFWE